MPRPSLARAVLPVWLVTAAWDAACATALSVFGYGSPAAAVWQGVAATALGSSAPSGATARLAAGLAVHMAVAFIWAAIFAVALAWPALRSAIRTVAGALAVAAAYGPLIWLVMSLLVSPLATGRPPRFGLRWWIQVGAHIPFVSMPLVFTARRVFRIAAA